MTTVIDRQIDADLALRARLHECCDATVRAAHLMLRATKYLNEGDSEAAVALLPVIRAKIEKGRP